MNLLSLLRNIQRTSSFHVCLKLCLQIRAASLNGGAWCADQRDMKLRYRRRLFYSRVTATHNSLQGRLCATFTVISHSECQCSPSHSTDAVIPLDLLSSDDVKDPQSESMIPHTCRQDFPECEDLVLIAKQRFHPCCQCSSAGMSLLFAWLTVEIKSLFFFFRFVQFSDNSSKRCHEVTMWSRRGLNWWKQVILDMCIVLIHEDVDLRCELRLGLAPNDLCVCDLASLTV